MTKSSITLRRVRGGGYVHTQTGITLIPSAYGWTIYRPAREGMESVESEWHFRVAYRKAKAWAADQIAEIDRLHATALTEIGA